MRFDDRLATLLAWEAQAAPDRVRIWRQLADLMEDAPQQDPAVMDRVIARLSETEQDVPLADRRRTIAAIDLARAPAAFTAYLARDPLAYGPLLPTPADRATFAVQAVRIGPARDLFGDDLFHEDPPEEERDDDRAYDREDADAPVAASQISDLLARIDAFNARRDGPVEGAGFAFEIDAEGALHTRDDHLQLAHCAEPPQGVDGGVAGAWRRGEPFADARLTVEDGPHAGEWRISADPVRSEGGRTIGYRGVARTPRPDETAVVAPSADVAPAVNASRLDAAIDRLRDPLEALFDAADPAKLPAGGVRDAADEVLTRSAALVSAIEALELAVAMAGDGGLDAAALLVRIDAALQPLADARGLKVSFRLARGLPPVDADPQAVERMVARLIGAVVSLGRRNEQIVARLGRDKTDGRMLALSVTRPGRFTGWPAQALLYPPAELQDADAPELGLSFALRLVDRLAQEAGGRLAIHADRIILSLPLPAEPRVIRFRKI
ncbi:hypothetical protein HL653_12845 [Sphingomonas sp. AP4-R1]|uniref:hypothetical protein n=1 Tax=Sphingomonas sp. AP4-R1 TaxID=2735134 RepID=UPI001493505B|nr:hypothetical protein [Sphingomonas sp. AP4-R1]QJU58534.1 hypothetical protein HL653_12845 [Sphingomonas sp. AP4-R1]